MLTSRERVRAALTFQHPDRTPRDLWALPYVTLFRQAELDDLLRAYPRDITGVQATPGLTISAEQLAQPGHYTDEWGSGWHVAEAGVIGEVKAPALADWSKLDHFQPPWHLLSSRSRDAINRSCAETDKFVLSEATVRPFERLQFLRGSENLFMDIAYDRAELRRLLAMVHDYYLKDIDNWCQTDVDGVMLMDDWGTNQRLLIRPQVWREMFKPLYKEYCDRIHAAGKFVFFHTDGHTAAIYDDFIEIGIDAINSQLFVMDIEDLARRYKGKITFWGEIDRQYALPFGTPDEVRAAVLRVRRALDDGSGGVIAQCEWGKDNTRANIETVFKTWLEPLS
jgi:hypothetical protein